MKKQKAGIYKIWSQKVNSYAQYQKIGRMEAMPKLNH